MGEFRKNFGRIRRILDIPNLIDIQNDSYRKFLQEGIDPDKRENYGLQGAFHSVFPISDFSGKCSLEFVNYRIGDVRYDMQECVQKGMTYEAPLKIVVRLVVFDTERNTEPKPIRGSKGVHAGLSQVVISGPTYYGGRETDRRGRETYW